MLAAQLSYSPSSYVGRLDLLLCFRTIRCTFNEILAHALRVLLCSHIQSLLSMRAVDIRQDVDFLREGWRCGGVQN